MSDNEKNSLISSDILANKKDIIKKKRGRPPSKINNDGIKKYKKNNLTQNYLSFCKNNKNGNLKFIRCSRPALLPNLCKNLSSLNVQISGEKKKRGRPRKIPSSTIDNKSQPKFEDSILSLITKNETESDDELFIEDIESKSETTLEAQNKLLNLLQKPPSFGNYTTNKIDDNVKQQGKKRGRPRKSDIQNCSNSKIPKVTENDSKELVNNSTISNRQKNKFLNSQIEKETFTCSSEKLTKDKSIKKRKKVLLSKSPVILPLNVKENSIITNSNNLEALNSSENTNTSSNVSLSTPSEHLKSKNDKLNSKLPYDQSIKNFSPIENQSDINSHSTEKTLSNLFKCDSIIPQVIEKKKRGRPRGSSTSKNKSSDSLFTQNNDNLMEKILGSFSNDISVKKKRGRPCKINLSQVPTNNILPTIDSNDQNSVHLKLQKLVNQNESLSKLSHPHDILISKKKNNFEGKDSFKNGKSPDPNQNLECIDTKKIYNNQNDLQNGEENLTNDHKNSINDTTVVVTLSSDGTYAIAGNLPKIPKILICNGIIENTNDCIKIPIQLIINNQSGNINAEMTPITLSPENLSRSESIPFGTDSNHINESAISARNNSFSSNTENQSNMNIKKTTSNSCFDNQRDALSTKLIHNESVVPTDQGNNSIACKSKNFISPTSISGLEEEYDDRPGMYKPFMPKSVLPININPLADDPIYSRKNRASSLPPFGSPK